MIISSRIGGPLLSLTIVGTVIGTTLSAKPQSTLGQKAGDVTKSRRGAALFTGADEAEEAGLQGEGQLADGFDRMAADLAAFRRLAA